MAARAGLLAGLRRAVSLRRAVGLLGAVRGRLLAETPLEPGDAAAGVHDLLLARVERVAARADVSVDHAILGGAPRDEGAPARAGHRGHHVIGVNIRLHVRLLVLAAAGSPQASSREPVT